jgi:hypothetical protein
MTDITIQLSNLRAAPACRRGHTYEPGSFILRQRGPYTVRDCILCRRVRESPTARATVGLPPRQPKK